MLGDRSEGGQHVAGARDDHHRQKVGAPVARGAAGLAQYAVHSGDQVGLIH